MTRRRNGPGKRAPTPQRLEQAALAYLARYASSAANLRRVLMRRLRRAELEPDNRAYGEAVAAIEALVARFRSAGVLDDRAYAEAQAASLSRRGLGRRGITGRLTAKGVDRDHIAAALGGLEAERAAAELAAALALARRRRLGPYRVPTERAGRHLKDLAAMARAGFALELARRVIETEDLDALERAANPPREP